MSMQLRSLALVLVPLAVVAGATAFFVFGPVAGDGAGASLPQEEAADSVGLKPVKGPDVVPAEEASPEAARRTAAGVPKTTAPEQAFVSGRVVDERGLPVAGAAVSSSDVGEFRSLFPDAEERLDELGLGGLDDLEKLRDRIKNRAAKAGIETASDGRFRLPVKAAGRSNLVVEARGFVRGRKQVTAKAGEETDVGDVVLVQGVLVSGHVVDPAGRGVAGARVVKADGGRRGMLEFVPPAMRGLAPGEETGKDGRFEILLDQPGEFSLVASHELHPDARHEGKAERKGDEVRGIVIRLVAGGEIEGTVVGIPEEIQKLRVTALRVEKPQKDSDNPFADMLGSVMSGMMDQLGMGGERRVAVGEDGSFRLRGLALGQAYQVWAMYGGGRLGGQSCTEPVRALAGAKAVRLVYAPGVTVTFQVVDLETGRPVTDYRVEAGLQRTIDLGILSTPMTNTRRVPAKPDTEGRVRIGGLRPKEESGILTVVVKATGYDTLEKKGVRIPKQGPVDLGVLRIRRAATVRVRVLAAATGAAIAGAGVTLQEKKTDSAGPGIEARREIRFDEIRLGGRGRGGSDRTRTDDAGWCTLHGSRGKEVFIAVTADDFAPYRGDPFSLTASAAVERVVRLSKGGTVEVTVVDSLGRVAAGVAVERRGPSDGRVRRNVETDAEGKATFEHLVAGEHEFRVAKRSVGGFSIEFLAKEKKDEGWKPVSVAVDQAMKLQLVRPTEASIVGVVTENGIPLVGARVRFLKGRGDGKDAMQGLEDVLGPLADRLAGGAGGARTDDKGEYRLARVEPGRHRLRVSHRELNLPKTFDVIVAPGENRQDLGLTTAIVSGLVTDENGDPVARATVAVRRKAPGGSDRRAALAGAALGEMSGMFGLGGRENRTDARGRFKVRGVPTGVPIVVTVKSKKHVPATSETLTLAAGQARDGVDFQLALGGSIRVEATGAGLLAAVEATYVGGRDVGPRMSLLKRGRAVLRGLQPGEWKVALRKGEDEAGPPKTVRVLAGETALVRLTP